MKDSYMPKPFEDFSLKVKKPLNDSYQRNGMVTFTHNESHSYNSIRVDWIKTRSKAWEPIMGLLENSSREVIVV